MTKNLNIGSSNEDICCKIQNNQGDIFLLLAVVGANLSAGYGLVNKIFSWFIEFKKEEGTLVGGDVFTSGHSDLVPSLINCKKQATELQRRAGVRQTNVLLKKRGKKLAAFVQKEGTHIGFLCSGIECEKRHKGSASSGKFIIGELYAHTSRMLYFCESCMQNHVHAGLLDSSFNLASYPYLPGSSSEGEGKNTDTFTKCISVEDSYKVFWDCLFLVIDEHSEFDGDHEKVYLELSEVCKVIEKDVYQDAMQLKKQEYSPFAMNNEMTQNLFKYVQTVKNETKKDMLRDDRYLTTPRQKYGMQMDVKIWDADGFIDHEANPDEFKKGLESEEKGDSCCGGMRFTIQENTIEEDIVRKELNNNNKRDEYWLNFETFAELLNRINGSKEYSTSSYCGCFGTKNHNEKWEGLPVDKNGAKTDEWPKKN